MGDRALDELQIAEIYRGDGNWQRVTLVMVGERCVSCGWLRDFDQRTRCQHTDPGESVFRVECADAMETWRREREGEGVVRVNPIVEILKAGVIVGLSPRQMIDVALEELESQATAGE